MATASETTVLVTGAGGFVGTALITELRTRHPGIRVAGLDRTSCSESSDYDTWYLADVSDTERMNTLICAERPSAIYHLAGLARGTDWEALYRANVSPTIALLLAVQTSGLECVVVIPGSAAEYGPVDTSRLPVTESEALGPISPYGVSKAWQTLAARSFVASGLDVRVARLFNMIGPRVPESFALGAFGQQLLGVATGTRPASIRTGYLESRRDYLDVRDAAAGLVAVALHGTPGSVYNVCSGRGVTMRHCLDLLITASGLDVDVTSEPPVDRSAIPDSVGSNELLKAQSGWRQTVTLKQSIADYWDWLLRSRA